MSEIDELLTEVAAAGGRYLNALPERPVVADLDVPRLRDMIDVELPAGGRDPMEVVTDLVQLGEKATVATAGPRYFGFVTGGTLPAALAAELLVVCWDQNAAMAVMSPVASVTEEVAGRWIRALLGLPPIASIGFVTGGQAANTTCLATARHHVLAAHGWDVEERGLSSSPPVHCIVGEDRHVAIDSAFRAIGLGIPKIVVDADDQGRMRPASLAEVLGSLEGPKIVCLQAGNVVTGAFDAFEQLVALSRKAGAWVHVDGAFGAWAAASPEYRWLTEGMGGADSWAVDGHKLLNVPYDCGYAITAHPEPHLKTCGSTATYFVTGGSARPRDNMNWVPETSRRARGVATYAALRSLGRDGVADLVDRCCANAQRFAASVGDEEGVEVLNDVVFNQVAVRFDSSDAHTSAVVSAVQDAGVCWAGPATWHGETVMRWSVSNWSTTPDDIDRSVRSVLEAHRAVRSC